METLTFFFQNTPVSPIPQSLSHSSGIQLLAAEVKKSIHRRCVQIKFCYKLYFINGEEYAFSN